MAATTLLTVDEFLKMPMKEGIKYELVHGQVVETNVMGTTRRFHERVKANCIRLLVAYILQHPLGEVFSETAFMLTEDLMCIPDISVIRQDRLGGDQNTLYEGSPALAIEVVSSDAAADLERKIEDYLAHGSEEAWVVYPEQKVIRLQHPRFRFLRRHLTNRASEIRSQNRLMDWRFDHRRDCFRLRIDCSERQGRVHGRCWRAGAATEQGRAGTGRFAQLSRALDIDRAPRQS